jgi:hypothetical protein
MNLQSYNSFYILQEFFQPSKSREFQLGPKKLSVDSYCFLAPVTTNEVINMMISTILMKKINERIEKVGQNVNFNI